MTPPETLLAFNCGTPVNVYDRGRGLIPIAASE